MRLSEIYKQNNKTVISFEVFPPKGDGETYKSNVDNLFEELNKLSTYNPSLISVTYGAGGSTREKTFDLVLKIKNTLNIETMAHFTCVNFNRTEILEYVKKLESNGINNILALRGDPPQGSGEFIPPVDGFSHANELIEFLKANTDLSIAAAGYPEKHPEAVNFDTDIENLIRKINIGAEVIFTQLFFDNNDYFKFVDKLHNKNVTIPIIPGIMVLQSISQIDRIINLSGSKIPTEFKNLLDKYADKSEDIKRIGIEYAQKQVNDLINSNVQGLHFYPLNKAYAVSEVLKNV